MESGEDCAWSSCRSHGCCLANGIIMLRIFTSGFLTVKIIYFFTSISIDFRYQSISIGGLNRLISIISIDSPFLPSTFFEPPITRSKSPELELFSISLEGSSYRESTIILLPAHSLCLFSSSPSRASRLSPVLTLLPFSFIRLPGSSH